MKTTVKYIKRTMNISTILLVIGAMVFVYTRKHSDISFLNSDNNRLYTGWTYINSAGEEVPYEAKNGEGEQDFIRVTLVQESIACRCKENR